MAPRTRSCCSRTKTPISHRPGGTHSPGDSRDRRSAVIDLRAAGVLFGLALASKWVAAYALAGLALAVLVVTALAYERGRRGGGGPLDLFRWRGLNVLF